MEEFIPTTLRMDVREEREAFFAQQEGVSNSESRMWICKPTGMNQGRGIFLLKSKEDIAAFRLKLKHTEDRRFNRKMHYRQPQAYIVQHYIQNPLLLKGKKFDVRSYLLIACTAPYVVFFRHGYVRLTCDLYDPTSKNLSAHLTNQYMQKKNPLYSQLKEDTVWSMESFNAYVNDRFQAAKDLPRDWVLGAFAKRMQQIMSQCFLAVKSKLDCRLGFFDLIGCDFLVDEDFKVGVAAGDELQSSSPYEL
ncbi:protein polyglycylase TTLL10 isoform X3 [Neolamprologus brichardi]|uniref:protein polyglycylase TTLL10 isoform X3 n=1 Tax=Neolamprologus brichardi TaxID=32507 RepID=UPI001643C325|nr:protein polyglycylase TTLL10 isoform X3 [Neolamprologus brichardi]